MFCVTYFYYIYLFIYGTKKIQKSYSYFIVTDIKVSHLF